MRNSMDLRRMLRLMRGLIRRRSIWGRKLINGRIISTILRSLRLLSLSLRNF
jgi:hypothetical protein